MEEEISNNFHTSTYYRMIVICDMCGKRWVTKKKKSKKASRCIQCGSSKTRRVKIWKVRG